MNRSKEEIKAEINDKTSYLYKHCLYADSTIEHQIVFYKNRLIHLIFSFFTSENNLGFCLTGFNRQIFIYKADFCTNNLLYDEERGPLSNYLYNRDKIMVHELVHSSMAAKLGYTNYRKLPKWLTEGYAEHIAHQSGDLCNYRETEYPYQPFYIQMENELTKHDGKIEELVNTFLK
ncbi:hypothetical protein [Runella sp.]|uniref:hypothetical protein n=1 Tax=Runella sp. TaxID=1960881 RepID=UPI003D14F257